MAEPVTGYIKMYRKAYKTNPFWLEKRIFSRWEAWEWILQIAPWGDDYSVSYEGHRISIPRGHFLGSVRHLASEWGWSKSTVGRFLSLLRGRKSIATVSETPAGTLYLIVNYEVYQGYETASGTVAGTGVGQEWDKNNTNNTSSLAGRFCAAVNKGLTEHTVPSKRQLVPRITPNTESTRQAVEAIERAGVDREFAERELFEAGRTHTSETHVTSLKYFAPRIIRLWEQRKAGQAASSAKIPADATRVRQSEAARIWAGVKRTNLLFAHNSDEWLAGVTQMHVADEIESVEWFRSLWKSLDLNTLRSARSDQYAIQHIASLMPANLRVVA